MLDERTADEGPAGPDPASQDATGPELARRARTTPTTTTERRSRPDRRLDDRRLDDRPPGRRDGRGVNRRQAGVPLTASRPWSPMPGESKGRIAFRVARSTLALTVIALGVGLALAATLGVIVWLIAAALHHASTA